MMYNNYNNQNDNQSQEENQNFPQSAQPTQSNRQSSNPNYNQNYNQNYNPNYNQSYPYIEVKPIKAKKHNGKKIGFAAGVISLAFCFSVLGGALGNALTNGATSQSEIISSSSEIPNAQYTPSSQEPKQEPEKTSGITKTATTGTALTMEEIAAVASPSVVEITTESITTGNRMQQLVATGAGSGVIISADGYIVTNNHVIEGSNKITVTLKDGAQYEATLLGTDKKTDLAVIKIKATGLTPATIGTSANIKVGQDAIVIGNPLGQLGGTVTNGIISALDRAITFEDGSVMNLLQTNAAVNPGNSGGGLFNNKGELVGIVNAKSSGTGIEGIGFAIPIDTARPIIEDLISHGYVQGRVYLGVTLLDINDPLTAMMYRLNETGVYIYDVDAGTNAAKAGVSSGDRIIQVNGTDIQTSTDVNKILDKQSVGDTVTLTIKRNGQTGKISFVLQEQKGSGIVA